MLFDKVIAWETRKIFVEDQNIKRGINDSIISK